MDHVSPEPRDDTLSSAGISRTELWLPFSPTLQTSFSGEGRGGGGGAGRKGVMAFPARLVRSIILTVPYSVTADRPGVLSILLMAPS